MRPLLALTVIVLAVVGTGCGDGETPDTVSPTVSTTAPSTSVPATALPTTLPTTAPTTAAPTTVPPTVPPTTVPTTDPTIVAWPPAGVRFTTPEAVAADFTARVFLPGAVLGAFRAGDSRSGEVEVYASDETGRPIGAARSVLLLREVDDRGWTVSAAVSEGATITSPEAGGTVGRSMVVAGRARGFEANVNVRAVPRSTPERPLDEQITFGGSLDRPRPYSVELDVSAAARGDVLLIVVRGGAGLETDPGDTAVIPVVRR